MNIGFSSSGDFHKTTDYLNTLKNETAILDILNDCGKQGVIALSNATPVDTGKTANSWGYNIQKTNKGYNVNWTNSNAPEGVSVAILIQYGHATKNGGYVQGRDYINPALRNIVNTTIDRLWKEVTK
jgi:hypothetical protein